MHLQAGTLFLQAWFEKCLWSRTCGPHIGTKGLLAQQGLYHGRLRVACAGIPALKMNCWIKSLPHDNIANEWEHMIRDKSNVAAQHSAHLAQEQQQQQQQQQQQAKDAQSSTQAAKKVSPADRASGVQCWQI